MGLTCMSAVASLLFTAYSFRQKHLKKKAKKAQALANIVNNEFPVPSTTNYSRHGRSGSGSTGAGGSEGGSDRADLASSTRAGSSREDSVPSAVPMAVPGSHMNMGEDGEFFKEPGVGVGGDGPQI